MKIEKYIEKIVSNGKREDMDSLSDMLEDLMYKVKEYDEDCYNEYKLELYEMANGKKLTEDMAKDWVMSMRPSAKWTMEETTEAARNLGYNVDPIEFYVVSNMMWSDYYNIVKDNPEMALKLAYDWLKDEDIGKDKLYNYWKYVS